jgi:hypothetical protein
MYAALYVLAVAALLGFVGWFASSREWEPGIGIVTSVGGLIALYLNDESRKAKATSYSSKMKDDLSRALARIVRESDNLQHIADGKPFKSESHRKAVEDTSLELLSQELPPLASYWRYRTLVRRVLAEIALVKSVKPRSVARLLPLVALLEAKLKQDRS